MKPSHTDKRRVTRRRFLAGGVACAATAAGVWSEVRAAASKSPNEKLNIGAIGVANRGVDNIHGLRSENIAALCDVDRRHVDRMSGRYTAAARYRDFREMLQHTDLDAVVISTPDHIHFHAALLAVQRGLHVYCERPLVQTVDELHRLADAAKMRGVATQMGNQHHNSRGYQRAAEYVQSGAIGAVREVHCWTNRPLWPQGLRRSNERPAVPDYLDWDLWLGPAPWRPYQPSYHPVTWRGWWDFGAAALGDMGPHLLDPAYRALQLAPPVAVQAESSRVSDESPPEWSIVRFSFAARGDAPPVELTWYDGGKRPPPQITGTSNPPANGALLLGERAKLFVPELGGAPIVIPRKPDDRIAPPEPSLPHSPGHYAEWIAACKGGPPASSDFAASAGMMETCLLGNVALRCGAPITWDADNRTTGSADADHYLRRSYREGWEI